MIETWPCARCDSDIDGVISIVEHLEGFHPEVLARLRAEEEGE